MNGLGPAAKARWPVKGAIAIFVVGCAAGLLAASRPTDQPFPFNHAAHSARSDCILCHGGARSEARAGLPSFDRCTGCHATAPGNAPDGDAEERWRSMQQGQPPRWNRLYEVPSHVYFSHRRHVTLGGIPCAQCHGDIAASDRPPRFVAAPASMRSCITCHEREQVTVDCTACHR